MLKVGITGAIGSGKSTVCRVFALLGVPVFDADAVAGHLLDDDPAVRSGIEDLFGAKAFHDGRVDKRMLAERVFHDEAALAQLNALVHPAVGRAFDTWCESHTGQPYVLKEAAILFESGAHRGLDHVIAVTAPEALRRQRTRPRYAESPVQFDLRQSRQWPEEKKAEAADFLIRNDEQELVIPQVLALHRKLTR